jgi:hypothetical protein
VVVEIIVLQELLVQEDQVEVEMEEQLQDQVQMEIQEQQVQLTEVVAEVEEVVYNQTVLVQVQAEPAVQESLS